MNRHIGAGTRHAHHARFVALTREPKTGVDAAPPQDSPTDAAPPADRVAKAAPHEDKAHAAARPADRVAEAAPAEGRVAKAAPPPNPATDAAPHEDEADAAAPPGEPAVAAAPAAGWQRWAAVLTRREPERIAGFGGILLAGLLAGVAALYAFVWLADEVLRQQTLALDTSVDTWFDQFTSPQWTLAARVISLLGSEAVFVVAVILLVAFVVQRRWGAAAMLVLASAGAQLLNDVLKDLFHRTRPIPLGGLIEAQQYSFPSGHAMVSAAFYFCIAYLTWRLIHGWWRVVVVAGLVLLVLLIGVARLYLHAHYLTDVAAGYLAGSLWTDGLVLGSRVLTLRSARTRRELHARTLNG